MISKHSTKQRPKMALCCDCYRVVKLNDSTTVKWEIEGRNLLTDETAAIIEYIRWEDDPNRWDGAFHQAFITFLTMRFATAFDSDMTKATEMFKLYKEQRDDAKAIDGQERSTEEMVYTGMTDDIRDE